MAVRETRELRTAPGMLGLYAKALAPKRGGAGSVPDTRLVLPEAPADEHRLRRYAEVCGFAGAERRMPVPYPHIAAFPLAMTLMTGKDFPYRLLGLVHIGNRIERLRPVLPSEPLRYEVWVEQPYAHPKGTAFDVLTEASAAGEVVWREASAYLRRGRAEGAARGERQPSSELSTPGLEALWDVPADIGRAYAAVSGDRNPIHLHPLSARLFGFPRAIAHGMWTMARCLAELEPRLPDAYRAEVSFRAPVLLPASVRFRAAERDDAWAFELRASDGGREHVRGSAGAFCEG